MQTTENLGLRKPEASDFYSVEDMNYNADVIDNKIKEIEDANDPQALKNHVENKQNPHGVTKDQVGLGNVPNVATNDQTPTYAVPSEVAELSSGEKLSVAFGKIAKAISSFISHKADTKKHITNGTLGEKVQANASAMATLTNAQLRDAVILESDPGEGASVSYSPGTIVFTK